MLAQVLLANAQHVWRGSRERFKMLVICESIRIAQIARFADAKNHGLHETIEASQHLLRGNLGTVPGSHRCLNRLPFEYLGQSNASPLRTNHSPRSTPSIEHT